MTNNPLVDTLIAMTSRQQVILVHKPFVEFTGSLEGAMLLSQLLYWTPRGALSDGWIAKTGRDFADELSFSEYRLRKAKDALVDLGVLETKVKRFAGSPTVHYRIKLEALAEKWEAWLSQMDFAKLQNPKAENDKTCTEITTETTTSPRERENTKQEDAAIFDRDFPPSAPSASLKETVLQRQPQDRPWLGWGEQSTALAPYSGIDVSSIKKVGYLLETEFGMGPVWADKQRARQWVRECAQLWEAAGGSLALIHTAATHGREQGLMLSRPGSLFNIVRGIAAEAKSQPLLEDRPPPGPRPAHRIQARKDVTHTHGATDTETNGDS